MSTPNIQNESTWKYAGLGFARAVGGLLIEQPLFVCKIKAQKSPHLSCIDVIANTYHSKEGSKFYGGFLPSLKHNGLKEAGRWSFLKFSHDFWSLHFPGELAPKIAVAISIAAFETGLLPLNRLVTAKVNEGGYRSFYERRWKKDGIHSLYAGARLAFVNRLVTWTSFMTSDHVIKSQIRQLDPTQKHYYAGKIFSIFMTAFFMSVFGLPFDYAKLHIQMDKTNALGKMSIPEVMRTLGNRHGYRAMYAGAIFDLSHRVVHVGLCGPILNRIMPSKA